MTDTDSPKLRDNPQVHFRGALIAAISVAVLLLDRSDFFPFDVSVFAIIGILVSLVLMFISRKADEYVAALWSAGTGAAFVAVVVWLLFAPVAEGFVDGLLGLEDGMDFPVDFASIAALMAFLCAFYWRHFRG